MARKRQPIQVQQFAEKAVRNGFNFHKAMHEITPDVNHKGTIPVKVHRWLGSIEVLKAIADEIRKLNIQPDDIKQCIRARMIKIISDNDRKDGDAIGASAVIAKVEGLLNEGTNIQILVDNREKGILDRYSNTVGVADDKRDGQ